MYEQDNPLKTVELSNEQNYNMIDGLLNNAPALPPHPPEKELDKVKEPPNKHRSYVLHVDLSDIRELVSLQRRCANNLNQVAIHVNTYGGIYPDEIKALQRDYADLWGPLSDLLKKLSAVVEL